MSPMPARPLALVSVASGADAALLARWETHLLSLQQAHLISVWSERHLELGSDRLRQIESADFVLLLLSPNFFADPECYALMEHALERSHTGTTRVIPLLLRP
jgi:TIR domain